jgi:hypothetical protein
MKDRYDGNKGKEAKIANLRHSRLESEHNANNAFVKKQMAMLSPMGGKAPKLEEKYMHFDSCMINDGEHAQEFGRKLTSGLDKKAYPVK